MAYMSQEKKKAIVARLKSEVWPKYPGMKCSVGVDNHSTIVLNINSGDIDFAACGNPEQEERAGAHTIRANIDVCGYLQVNRYYIERDWIDPARAFLLECVKRLNDGNHDRSDIQSDHFDVGWYIEINIGRWDRPYLLTTKLNPPVVEVK